MRDEAQPQQEGGIEFVSSQVVKDMIRRGVVALQRDAAERAGDQKDESGTNFEEPGENIT